MYSQNFSITSTVKDATDIQSVEFATITISNLDSTIVNSCFAKEYVIFSLEKMKEGEYIFCASFIGYKPFYKSLKLAREEDVGDILLDKDEKILNEVVVIGECQFVQQKIDRCIVNISDHI